MIRSPFKKPERLTSVQNEVNSLLEKLWRLGVTAVSPESQDFVPLVEIREEADKYVVMAELPGMPAEEVEVSAAAMSLTISGEKSHPLEPAVEVAGELPHILQSERRYGRFSRTITLPGAIQVEAVTAAAHDGVLEIHLPKTAGTRPVQIRVDVKP